MTKGCTQTVIPRKSGASARIFSNVILSKAKYPMRKRTELNQFAVFPVKGFRFGVKSFERLGNFAHLCVIGGVLGKRAV